MANKYEIRRRALKEAQGRPENPFASPHSYTPPPPLDRRGTTIALCLGLVVLITALYVQTAGHKFTVCDDNVYVYDNPNIKSGLTWSHVAWAFSDAHEGNWHPLTWISHMLDWQTFGKWQPANDRYVDSWPGGHHLVSMGIHIANAVLLFLALRLMTGALWPSFVVAALFGIHPLRVESVAWAAERKDVLCGLFWMASMLAYAYYARRRPIRTTSFVAAFGIAAILCIVFIRLLVLPDLSPLQSTVPAILIGIGVVGLLAFTSITSTSWLTQLPEIGSYLLITVLIALGLMAKSMIVTLPCVFLLLDIWPLGRWTRALWPPGRRDPLRTVFAAGWLLVEKIPWFLLAYLDSEYTIYGQNKGVALNSFEGLPLSARLLNAVESCGEYLRQTVWPTGLAPFYAHPHMIPDGWTRDFYVRFGIYLALLLMITGVAVWFLRKRPFLAVGWFWYLGTLMPVIGIIQVGTQARADRYTYLPMIGVYLMVAWLLKEVADRWPQTRVALSAAAAVVLAALSAVTFYQVSYWVDSYKLFQHAAAVTENNYFAYNHIGIAFDKDAKEAGTIDAKAEQELFNGVAKYFHGPPKSLNDGRLPLLPPDAAENFDAALAKLNRFQQQQLLFDYSAAAFKASIDIKPDYDFGNNNLGVYYARPPLQNLPLAERYFRGALTSNQRYADAFNNLGIVLRQQGSELRQKGKLEEGAAKLDEAIFFHKKGLEVRYDRASDHNNLCGAYLERGDLEDAMRENSIALQCDPNFLEAYNSRAEIYYKQNNFEQAAKCVLRMVTIDSRLPQTIAAEVNFSRKCTDLKRYDEALDLLTQSLKINPAVPEIYYARTLVSMQKGDWNLAGQDLLQLVRLIPRAPETVQAELNFASKCIELRRYDQAIDFLAESLKINDAVPEIYHARAVAYLRKGDLNRAEQDLVRVVGLAPQFPGAQAELNEVRAHMQK